MVFLEILKNIMVQNVRPLNLLNQIYLLHDNSPVQKNKLVQNWLKIETILLLLIGQLYYMTQSKIFGQTLF